MKHHLLTLLLGLATIITTLSFGLSAMTICRWIGGPDLIAYLTGGLTVLGTSLLIREILVMFQDGARVR